MSSEIFLMILISFFIPLLLSIVLVKKKSKDLVTRKFPLGPKKLPIIGNLHQLGKLPHRSLQKLSKTYGDPMLLQLGSVPVLIVSTADTAREILKTHDLAFSGRPSLYAIKKITYNLASISFAPYGEYWRELRKIVVLELLSLKRVQSFHKIRAREVALLIDRISSTTRATNLVNLSSLTFSLSNDVVCGVAFGTTCSDDHGSSRFQELLLQIQHLAAEFNVADYFPWMAWINRFNGTDQRIDRNFRDIDEFFNKVIEEHGDPDRAKTDDQDDIIDVLLRIQKDPDQGFALKNEHIKGVLMDIFAAGTDTSSALIIWTMTELMRNPKVKERVEEEVRRVCKGKVKVEENDLKKLSYLKLVIKESLRLHPPAPLMLPRETIENCIIDNKYEIPAKTRIILNALAIGTDPKYWENPEKFWPERFSNSEIDFRGLHFELLPFGAGRRGCPGINFAISTVEVALANLLFCFDWELPQGISAENIDMEEELGVTVYKKIPLCLVASPVNV